MGFTAKVPKAYKFFPVTVSLVPAVEENVKWSRTRMSNKIKRFYHPLWKASVGHRGQIKRTLVHNKLTRERQGLWK